MSSALLASTGFALNNSSRNIIMHHKTFAALLENFCKEACQQFHHHYGEFLIVYIYVLIRK